MLPRRSPVVLAALSLAAALCACGVRTGVGTAAPVPPGRAVGPSGVATFSPVATRSSVPADPARVHANELGQVPVLMFHQVLPAPRSDFDISPTDFRALLEQLAAEHYVPVTAADYAAGRLDIPAGTSPVVLTFDDSTRSQFALGPDQSVAPLSAVGILLAVAAQHPGFTPVATFYLNEHPFGQRNPGPYLNWLTGHHFELGNHSLTHANLRQLTPARVQQELAGEQQQIGAAVPGYAVSTMALPFGAEPRPATLARQGNSEGVVYDYRAVMLVGANPAPSPFAATAGVQVPRIRAASQHLAFDAQYWLPRLAESRYISDGDPAHISFPRRAQARLAAGNAALARPY